MHRYLGFIDQFVRTYHGPFDLFVILTNLGAQIIRRLFVVHVWREQ